MKFQKVLQQQLSQKSINFYYANHTDESIEASYRQLLPNANIANVKSKLKVAENPDRWGANAHGNFYDLMTTLEMEENFFFK